MKGKKKIQSILIFTTLFFIIDLFLTQVFLFNFYYSNLEKQYISDIENRVLNKNYKYTFAKKKNFESTYQGHKFNIKTNNLGFRDHKVRDLNINKNYVIVIGDSFVEGLPLDYEDTIVGQLNKNLLSKKNNNYEFLNAGVASYSTYIYKKKIINILEENSWIKTNLVILLLDKSDVYDDLSYLDKPEHFPLTERKYKSRFKEEFFADLKNFNFWRFVYKQTTTGSFIKLFGDFVEMKIRNLRDRYKLSKKINKNFFQIKSKQVKSFRSINTKTYITNFFYGDLWNTEGKKSINFSIENILNLKTYLESKNIDLLVVLYPWPFELADEEARNNYVKYITPKLKINKIDFVSAYPYFLEGDVYSNISDNYIFNDIHFNANGSKILSNVIWKNILNKF